MTVPGSHIPVTERIADFVVAADLEVSERVAVAQQALADTLAVAVAGTRTDCVRILNETYSGDSDTNGVTVIGRSSRASVATASLINGAAAHALDFDDTLTGLTVHPSCHLVPALLAITEITGATGPQFLAALLVGMEVESRLAATMRPWHYESGWHSTSTIGTIASAAAASRLLGLSRSRVQCAIGIAVSAASGVQANFGSMTKPLHAGRAARAGVEAALLARADFDASSASIEHPKGFLRVMGSRREDSDLLGIWDPNELKKLTATSCLSFKLYPCCGEAGAAVHAAIDLGNALTPEDILEVDLGLSPFGMEILRFSRPETPDQARFSAEYCVASALLDHQLTVEAFSQQALERSAVQSLLAKVRVHARKDLPHEQSATLTIRTAQDVLNRVVEVPPGHFSQPFSTSQLRTKFLSCTEAVLGGTKAADVLASCLTLGDLTDLRPLIRTLGCGATN